MQPTMLVLTAGDKHITATWTAPADGGSRIFLYHLQYKLSASNVMCGFSQGTLRV
ncbi:MAG: fibronectin type III domain-containing protein [Salinispira sp.]